MPTPPPTGLQPADPLHPTPTYTAAADPATFPTGVEDLLRDLNLADPTVPHPAPDPDPPPAGIPGYELLGEVGRGGMGVVYKARHLGLNRVVALKMIRPAGPGSGAELVRFLAEAEAVAAVRHPNVVQVYDLGGHRGRPFYAMEYVGGGNLSGYLRARGRLDPLAAAGLIEAVARGVQAAHDAGIVHRDLKPSNILLSGVRDQGSGVSEDKNPGSSLTTDHCPLTTPKVADFGLAKRAQSDLTHSEAVLGTPAYMAPEQAGGRAKFVGPAADVYALGVILYECLTGAVPFRAEHPLSLVRQVCEAAPEPPRKRVPGVPRDLELICLKCLEKEPHHRYPSAEELAADLRRFLDREPVQVRPVSAVARAGRWARRHPAPTAAGVLLFALLVGVPWAVLWYRGEMADKEAERLAAHRAKVEAERLAAARELFALESGAARRAIDRMPGWTWANRADLATAAGLGPDPATRRLLRTTAAATLLSPDLRPLSPLPGKTGFSAATSPTGSAVAVGEFHALAGMPCQVRVLDPAAGTVVRDFYFTAALIWQKGGPVPDGVWALAFAPDGNRLFVGTRGGRVYRFDFDRPGPSPAADWKVGAAALDHVLVSPDGKAVYTVNRPESQVRKWDAETGARLGAFDPPGGAKAAAVEPGTGDLIVAGGPALYRVDPAAMTARGPGVSWADRPRTMAFAGGGRVLAVGMGDRLYLADPATLKPTVTLTDPDLRTAAHEDLIAHLAVHPSGAYLATTAEGRDRGVKVWKLAAGRLVEAVTVPGTHTIAPAWSPDGTVLVATSALRLHRFEFAPPAAATVAALHARPIEAAAFAPDGRVAALGAGPSPRTAFLSGGPADAVTAEIPEGRGAGSRPGLGVNPRTGAVAITCGGPGIVLWVPGTPPGDAGFTRVSARTPRYSADGAALWAVINGSAVRAWDADGGAIRGTFSHDNAEIFSGLQALDALAVGRERAAVGGEDGSVRLLGPKAEVVGYFPRPGDPVLSVAVARDDAVAAAGGQSGVLRVIRDGREEAIPTPHAGGVTAVAVARGGDLLVTGGKDRTVRVWRRGDDGYEVVYGVSDLPAAVRRLDLSADGRRLLVLPMNEHAVRVWDLEKLREQLTELGLGW